MIKQILLSVTDIGVYAKKVNDKEFNYSAWEDDYDACGAGACEHGIFFCDNVLIKFFPNFKHSTFEGQPFLREPITTVIEAEISSEPFKGATKVTFTSDGDDYWAEVRGIPSSIICEDHPDAIQYLLDEPIVDVDKLEFYVKFGE